MTQFTFFWSIHKKPISPCRTFLSCLPSTFGLKETDLFQPSHLYDYTDFARVLHTLSKVNFVDVIPIYSTK